MILLVLYHTLNTCNKNNIENGQETYQIHPTLKPEQMK